MCVNVNYLSWEILAFSQWTLIVENSHTRKGESAWLLTALHLWPSTLPSLDHGAFTPGFSAEPGSGNAPLSLESIPQPQMDLWWVRTKHSLENNAMQPSPVVPVNSNAEVIILAPEPEPGSSKACLAATWAPIT